MHFPSDLRAAPGKASLAPQGLDRKSEQLRSGSFLAINHRSTRSFSILKWLVP
jgi:hypothetical protein